MMYLLIKYNSKTHVQKIVITFLRMPIMLGNNKKPSLKGSSTSMASLS
jgi:hypothetical protein